MRHQGVDIFPDCDSHCYIEGLPLKDIPTEKHLYYCMALTANALRFISTFFNIYIETNVYIVLNLFSKQKLTLYIRDFPQKSI